MSKKKELNQEDLEEVIGGANLDSGVIGRCPNCNKNIYSDNCETLGSGCDTYKRYTCSHCGHQWEKH